MRVEVVHVDAGVARFLLGDQVEMASAIGVSRAGLRHAANEGSSACDGGDSGSDNGGLRELHFDRVIFEGKLGSALAKRLWVVRGANGSEDF